MADYKRFVSYMYEYEYGVKRKNVGYARVEIRNGECRFTIHMQLDGLQEGIFPTYLIHRPSDEMDLVYLGDCSVKNQVMDTRLNATEFNVMDSGYRFSDMGGILLFLDTGVFYATQWDDKPVVLEDVLQALKPKSKKEVGVERVAVTKEIPVSAEKSVVDNTKESKPEIETADTMQIINKRTPVSAPIIDRRPTAYSPIIVKKPTTTAPLSTKKPTTTAPLSTKKPSTAAPISVKRAVEQKNDMAKKKNIETNPPRYILPGGGVMNYDVTNSQKKTHTNPWELVERYKKAEEKKESKTIENTEVPMNKIIEENMHRENPLTAKIFASFPRIYPFEDNEIRRCVKIEPKDIGVLPSDTWILSNNSFLLHGYYCYHHLIFAEISDSYGCHYILGIPGIYHNRERFMARMFGFECFKSIRKREIKQGDFGYWYLEVNF